MVRCTGSGGWAILAVLGLVSLGSAGSVDAQRIQYQHSGFFWGVHAQVPGGLNMRFSMMGPELIPAFGDGFVVFDARLGGGPDGTAVGSPSRVYNARLGTTSWRFGPVGLGWGLTHYLFEIPGGLRGEAMATSDWGGSLDVHVALMDSEKLQLLVVGGAVITMEEKGRVLDLYASYMIDRFEFIRLVPYASLGFLSVGADDGSADATGFELVLGLNLIDAFAGLPIGGTRP